MHEQAQVLRKLKPTLHVLGNRYCCIIIRVTNQLPYMYVAKSTITV